MKTTEWVVLIAVVVLMSAALAWRHRTPVKNNYLMTYQANLKNGGWTVSDVNFSAEKINAEVIEDMRRWVRTNRTDVVEGVCVLNIIKLED